MEESNCNHIFYKSKINEYINFCYTCGVVKYQNIIAILPNNTFKRKIEIEDSNFFQKLKLESIKEKELKINNTYKLNKITRQKILEYFKKLIKVSEYTEETYYLACLLLDHLFLQNESKSINLGLATVSCYIIASKFYETDVKIPNYCSFKKTGGIRYNPEEVKTYEVFTLKLLDYKLDYFTCYDVIKLFMNSGLVINNDFLKQYSKYLNCFIKEFTNFSFYILEEILGEINTVYFTQLELASACLLISSELKYPFVDIKTLLFKIIQLDEIKIEKSYNSIKMILAKKYLSLDVNKSNPDLVTNENNYNIENDKDQIFEFYLIENILNLNNNDLKEMEDFRLLNCDNFQKFICELSVYSRECEINDNHFYYTTINDDQFLEKNIIIYKNFFYLINFLNNEVYEEIFYLHQLKESIINENLTNIEIDN